MSENETITIHSPGSEYLVYTSAGDRSNLSRWLKGRRNFDVWVTYYGQRNGRYSQVADYYNIHRGGKFPNLHHVYQTWPELLKRYRSILALDDDILIGASAISRLFEIHEREDLWLAQPALDPRGKISHAITRRNRRTFLRYTNFIEVNCPLFRKDKLDEFMQVYDPRLVGWGIDWWFVEVLGPELRGKVAIVDAVTCINPHDRVKGGQREIDTLQPTEQRIAVWNDIKTERSIQSQRAGTVEYGLVPRSPFGKCTGLAQAAFVKALITGRGACNRIWSMFPDGKAVSHSGDAEG